MAGHPLLFAHSQNGAFERKSGKIKTQFNPYNSTALLNVALARFAKWISLNIPHVNLEAAGSLLMDVRVP